MSKTLTRITTCVSLKLDDLKNRVIKDGRF
ncbi:MAG: hypothetical protein CM15mP117_18540 [Alphaproteobacteria bacterium]|nr:MAG: hypothetical protein CM15mP117_18540 [Alphaproteobacteria bacterium]